MQSPIRPWWEQPSHSIFSKLFGFFFLALYIMHLILKSTANWDFPKSIILTEGVFFRFCFSFQLIWLTTCQRSKSTFSQRHEFIFLWGAGHVHINGRTAAWKAHHYYGEPSTEVCGSYYRFLTSSNTFNWSTCYKMCYQRLTWAMPIHSLKLYQ